MSKLIDELALRNAVPARDGQGKWDGSLSRVHVTSAERDAIVAEVAELQEEVRDLMAALEEASYE